MATVWIIETEGASPRFVATPEVHTCGPWGSMKSSTSWRSERRVPLRDAHLPEERRLADSQTPRRSIELAALRESMLARSGQACRLVDL